MSERPPPPPWEDPRRALARHGLAPKRSFSQCFLVARPVVERIADAVELTPGEEVVELGPGLGTLTAALLRRGARVIAVERDRDMAAALREDLAGQPVRVVEADAATFDLPAEAPAVGNLPYAVTGAILENLVRQRARGGRAVLMVQREVRDRLVARPGTKAYGALTVFVSAAFDVARVLDVGSGSFHPRPRVDSAVVRLLPLDPPRADETTAFRSVVKAAFGQRRKTLRNALRAAGIDADAALEAARIDGGRRGETLCVEELAAVAREAARSDPRLATD